MQIIPVSSENLSKTHEFLKQHEESSQFLIGNLAEHGPSLTTHPNSGNFKLLLHNDQIKGVFCLTRRGNLLAQSEAAAPELILKACASEPVKLRGFIGDWASIEPVWQLFQQENPGFEPSFNSKEILYSYPLTATDTKIRHDLRVRLLEEKDFAQWLDFDSAYKLELNLPEDLTPEEIRGNFTRQVRAGIVWGMFAEEKMLSRTLLNSLGKTIGQVGGVFTPKEHRQKGYSKATMFHMLKDCRDRLGHTKSILFTGETDLAARALYESMGYKQIGAFALILS